MRIGIDLGGSHISIGLIEEGEILNKKEKDFSEEERNNIKEVIENVIVNSINDILIEEKMKLSEIELIGIAAPRYS